MAISQFDAPIPGQSLTDAPGNAPWEHPPQYNEPESALEFIYEQCMDEEHLAQIIAFLKAGTPVEALTRIILFSGFSQGKWSPDLIALMAKPVGQLIYAIGKRAKVKDIVTSLPKSKTNNLDQIAELDAQQRWDNGDIHDKVHEETPSGIPLMGVLMRRSK